MILLYCSIIFVFIWSISVICIHRASHRPANGEVDSTRELQHKVYGKKKQAGNVKENEHKA